MNIEEFQKVKFGAGMKCLYDGITYNLVSVDFIGSLVGLNSEFEEELLWVRCENIELV